MNRKITTRVLCLLVFLGFAVPTASQTARSVSGIVKDRAGNPLPKAVVELENKVTLLIRSYITDAEGRYFFADLSTEVDFTLKAQYKGHWSKTETLSRFNEAKHAHIDLVIPID
jgi:hypothetical protein